MNHHRYSCFNLEDIRNWSSTQYATYSCFKYGCGAAAEQLVSPLRTLFNSLFSDYERKQLVFTSSAFKHIPTASNHLTTLLTDSYAGLNPDRLKIHRMNISERDYAFLNSEERILHSEHVKLSVDLMSVYQRDVVVIDDVYFTGAHEANLVRLLGPYVKSITFLYLVDLKGGTDPLMESNLNHFSVENLWDISEIISEGKFLLNARIAKYILGYSETELVYQFFSHQEINWLENFYHAIQQEGFEELPAFKKNIRALEEVLQVTPWLSA